jgi:hypothetical protein
MSIQYKKKARPPHGAFEASPEEDCAARTTVRCPLSMNANISRTRLDAYRRPTAVQLAHYVVMVQRALRHHLVVGVDVARTR